MWYFESSGQKPLPGLLLRMYTCARPADSRNDIKTQFATKLRRDLWRKPIGNCVWRVCHRESASNQLKRARRYVNDLHAPSYGPSSTGIGRSAAMEACRLQWRGGSRYPCGTSAHLGAPGRIFHLYCVNTTCMQTVVGGGMHPVLLRTGKTHSDRLLYLPLLIPAVALASRAAATELLA